VSEPITVHRPAIVSESVEAVRRLKEGFVRTKGQLGQIIAIDQEIWEGDTLQFQMRAFGQVAAGTIEVLEDALRIEVSLPWILAKAAKTPSTYIAQGSHLLLERRK
jgi:hypothetical protein